MRILLFTVPALLFIQNVAAQVPLGYYDSAYNGAIPKTCAALKTALWGILARDTHYVAYNSADGSYDTQDAVNNFDVRRNDANTADIIWDMYTDNPSGPELFTFNIGADQCGSSFPSLVGACYNREHAFPRSWFGDDFHIRGDLHNVFATDGETNAKHANWPYGEVGVASWVSTPGAKLGASSSPGYNGTVFEVIDEYKGDFARVMFYMVTAYEGAMPAWQSLSNANSVLDGTSWPSIDNWAISQWYQWHVADPVSAKEITRNDSVYAVQGNRNPFVDHPEYVALIWQCTGLLPVTITDFIAVEQNDKVSLQWRVALETNFKHYEVQRSVDGVLFNTIAIVTAANKPVYNTNDANLPKVPTVYYRLKMVDIDGKETYSSIQRVALNSSRHHLVIYPNPAVDDITIALPQGLLASSVVSIKDIAGKELLRQKIVSGQNSIQLKLPKLTPGMYYVFVQSNEKYWHNSFVISK